MSNLAEAVERLRAAGRYADAIDMALDALREAQEQGRLRRSRLQAEREKALREVSARVVESRGADYEAEFRAERAKGVVEGIDRALRALEENDG